LQPCTRLAGFDVEAGREGVEQDPFDHAITRSGSAFLLGSGLIGLFVSADRCCDLLSGSGSELDGHACSDRIHAVSSG